MAGQTRTDPSTLIGILVAGGLVIMAIGMGGDGSIKAFIDYPSVLIVLGGTFGVTMACFTIAETLKVQKTIFKTIFYSAPEPSKEAIKVLELAEVARRDGILKLQDFRDNYQDTAFLAKGIDMIIDGMDPKQAEVILYQDINGTVERHQKGVAILRKAAEIAPAMGLIGTLIGLVQMLGSLEDPAGIGPAMATALLTTFYGAMLAYIVFTPLASKLERNTREELLLKRLYAQGILSIGRKENPRRLEMLINTILPPEKRVTYFAQ